MNRTTRRFLLDNLVLYLWAGFLVPLALWIWTAPSPWAVLLGLVLGELLAMALVSLPMLHPDSAGPAHSLPSPDIHVSTASIGRLLLATAMFGLSSYLAYAFLLALLDDLEVLRPDLGLTGLAPGSAIPFLVFLAYWTFLLSLVADRLVVWIRELLKIERLVFAGFAIVFLALGLIRGLPALPMAEHSPPALTLVIGVAAFVFGFQVVVGLFLESWRGVWFRLGPCLGALSLLQIVIPLTVGLVLAALIWLSSPETPVVLSLDELAARTMDSGGPIPSAELRDFHNRAQIFLPWAGPRALLDLALCLGAMGVGVHLAFRALREIPAPRSWKRRLAWCLGATAIGSALFLSGAFESVSRFFLVLALVAAPWIGLRIGETLTPRRTLSTRIQTPVLLPGLIALGLVVPNLETYAISWFSLAAPIGLIALAAVIRLILASLFGSPPRAVMPESVAASHDLS